MDVRNAWEIRRDVGMSRHRGQGKIENWHLFESEDWDSNLTIIGYYAIPPGATIAVHPHIHEEKLYIVLEGKGIITVNDQEREVVPGDAIPLKAGGSHGIRNHTDEELLIFVVECKMTREAKLESEKVPVALRGATDEVVAAANAAKQ